VSGWSINGRKGFLKMGCDKRERGEPCPHSICPYPDMTDHGYECVDIIEGFCEVGEDCYPECEFSWQSGTKRADEAFLAFLSFCQDFK